MDAVLAILPDMSPDMLPDMLPGRVMPHLNPATRSGGQAWCYRNIEIEFQVDVSAAASFSK